MDSMPEGSPTALSARVRWTVMLVSLFVTASSFLFINGIAFLIPSLEAARGIPLAEAGLLSSMPSWGMVATLVGWGYVLDRVGERIVLTGLGAHRGRGLCRGIGPFAGVDRCLPVSRRHGRGELQHRRRPAGVRLVPAAPTRPGHGHPPDRATAGNRLGRAGNTRAGRTRPARGAHVSGVGVRARRRWPVRSASSIRRGNPGRRPPKRNWPARTAGRPCCGESMRWRAC